MSSWSVIKIYFRKFAWATVSLPLGAFIFCVCWAIYSDFNNATQTHCNVKNYLPSISAAIGGYPVSRRVWKWCIGLHVVPRFIVIAMNYKYMNFHILADKDTWISIACFMSILENVGLIGLTYVSSKDDYRIHERFVYIFMLSSIIYMIITCALLQFCRRTRPSALEKKSLRYKWKLLLLNIASFLMAGYAFIQHNASCQPGMYTIFAIMEYLAVLTNMGFHMTAYWDFYKRIWTIDLLCCTKIDLSSDLIVPRFYSEKDGYNYLPSSWR